MGARTGYLKTTSVATEAEDQQTRAGIASPSLAATWVPLFVFSMENLQVWSGRRGQAAKQKYTG